MREVISHYKSVNGDGGFGEWEVDQVGCTAELNLTEF